MEFPWAIDPIGKLWKLRGGSATFAISQIAKILYLLNYFDAHTATKVLLHLAFRETRVKSDTTAQELTDEQRLALSVIARSNNAWEYGCIRFNSFYEWQNGERHKLSQPRTVIINSELRDLDLPYTQEELQKFLG